MYKIRVIVSGDFYVNHSCLMKIELDSDHSQFDHSTCINFTRLTMEENVALLMLNKKVYRL